MLQSLYTGNLTFHHAHAFALHRIPSTPGSICPCPFFFSLYVGLIHINGLTLSLNALLANGYCACARVRAVPCLVPVPSYIASYSPRRQTALLGFYFLLLL